MSEVINLLDSSEDESPPPPQRRRGASNDDAICIDSDDEEETASSKRPQHQASIASDSSDEERAEKSVVRMPLQVDDSDFDSSDDERDLEWYRNKMKQQSLKNRQSSIEAVSTTVSRPVVPSSRNEQKPSAMLAPPKKEPTRHPPRQQSSALPFLNSRDSNNSSTGKLRIQNKQAPRTGANDRQQTARSPGGTGVMKGEARISTPVRRSLSGNFMKQATGGTGSSSFGLGSKQMPSNARSPGNAKSLGIPRKRPQHVGAGRENVAKGTSEQLRISPKTGGRAASVLARHTASLVPSKPIFGKSPQRQKANGTAQIMTANSSNSSSIARKRPLGKGPKKPSPTRKLPAVNGVKALVPPIKPNQMGMKQQQNAAATNKHPNIAPNRMSVLKREPTKTPFLPQKMQASKGRSKKFTFGTTSSSNKKSKTKPIAVDNDLVALGRKKGNRYSSMNERVRKGATNKPPALESSPLKSIPSVSGMPAPESQQASLLQSQKTNPTGNAKRNEGGDSWPTKRFSTVLPHKTSLADLSRKKPSDNARTGKPAPILKRSPVLPTQKTNLAGQLRSNESENARLSKSASTSKFANQAQRSEGGNARIIRPASILKRSSPLSSQKTKLAGQSRLNESDNACISKPTPSQRTKLVGQTQRNESDNIRLSKLAPTLKRPGPARESDGNERPQKQLKQILESVCVDRTVSPTRLAEQGETPQASQSTEQARSVACKSDVTVSIDIESPFPSDKDKSSQDSSSRGSVVSPTEDGDNDFECPPVSSRSLGNETSLETSPKDAKNESTKQAERPPPVSYNPEQSKEPGDNAIPNSGSSEFSESSDSDSESGDSSEIVTGCESLLHDSISANDAQKLWRRKTAKRVNYSEPSDDIEMTGSQSYLDSTPKENVSKSNEWIPVPFVKRTSKRKREVLSGSYSDSGRRPEPASPDADEGDDIVKECAAPIEHLSKYTYDENGLPTHEFSVLAADDTIYDLKVQVKESSISGAGHGAFLTFEGARVLKGELRESAARKREACVPYEPETMEPLEAVTPDGCGVTVSLTGKNLHGNRNIHLQPLTLTPLDAIIPTDAGNKRVNVKLSGDHLHYEDSDDEEEPLGFSMCPKRIGHLGIHTAKDYVFDPSIELSSLDFSVELGRYGPVLKSDRHREPDYDVKNYLFSDAPAEYGFGVNEEFAGCNQIIDITDDVTGTRHEAALRLPMSYINECGHNPNLTANVQIREKNDRSVYYYLTLPKALKKGETIELLADYDESYEGVRERKGYGKANIENGLKGDDHEPTALKRNFEERDFIAKLIGDLDTVGTFHLTEFVFYNILEPLDGVIREYLSAGGEASPTCLQWVARLRLNWLSGVLLSRIPYLLQNPSEELPESTNDNLVDQVRKWAEQMKWHSCSECVDVLAKRDTAALGALRMASRSEILYTLSGTIVRPLDEAMWCPLAVELIQNLSDDTAFYLSSNDENRDEVIIQSYLRHAKKASQEITNAACCDQTDSSIALSKLKFISSVAKDEIVDESTLKSFEGFEDPTFFSKNSTFRKGILASLLEVQAYLDSMELADVPKQSDLKIIPNQAKPHEVVIVDGSGAESGGASVYGYPRHLDSVVKYGRVNKDWYLLWQVVYIVNCFSDEFLGKGQNGENILSLERVCKHVGVDHAKAQAVVEKGIDTKEYSIAFAGQKATSRRPKKRAPRQRAPRQAARKRSTGRNINRSLFDAVIWKALVGLGWKLDVGTRPTDFYFLPPGVFRRRGWSNRKDYWDSVKLVMSHIRNDKRWKDVPEVVSALDLFDKLVKFNSTLKLPKNIDVDELIRQYKESCSS